jgi:AraC-like DNA-binding protein
MDVILARHGPEDAGREAYALTAVGAMTRYLDAVPLPLRIGVRFQPGAGPVFLRASAAALTDVEVPLAELWGAEATALLEQLAVPASLAARLRALEAWLGRCIAAAPPVDDVVRGVVDRIVRHDGRIGLRALSAGAGLGERQLRRRFEAAVGLGPKRLARIVRLQHAIRLGTSAGAPGLAQLAVDAGFYDQAHMIAEFRTLAGRTPPAALRAAT